MAAVDARLLGPVDALIDHIGAGGKRLRPRFLCSGWLAAPGPAPAPGFPEPVLRAAAALELIQACALLHDDIIDRSDTRRGRPATHRAAADEHAEAGWSGESEHFGLSTALLLGDLALAWADDLFVEAALDLGTAAAALLAWRAMRTEVLAGQLLDLRVSADQAPDPDRALADAMTVDRHKTAAYTVERPLHLGAALAGAGPDTIAALRAYGAAIGVAFQLRDDLLGMFGDPAVTGKPAGDDLIEGKKTVLLATARAALASQPDELAQLDGGMGRDLSPAEVHALTALVASSGAVAATEDRIDDLLATGLEALEVLDSGGQQVIAPATVDALRDLALAATARTR